MERITEVVIDRYTVDVAYFDPDDDDIAHAVVAIIGGPPPDNADPMPETNDHDHHDDPADLITDSGEIIGRVHQ